MRAWTDCCAPLAASPRTRSHMSMMAAQSSEVRFSSVALAANQATASELVIATARLVLSPGACSSISGWGMTYRRPHRRAPEPRL